MKNDPTHTVDALANYLERKFLSGLERLGEKRALQFARLVAPLFTLSHRSRRHQNLERFFGRAAWDAGRRKQFDRGHYDYLARLFAEQAYFGIAPYEHSRHRVSLSGAEHVAEALRLGRGALVISGHVGNYRFIPAILGYEGYDVTVVFRAVSSRANEKYFSRLAGRFNVRVVFTYQNTIEACRAALQNNGLIYIAFDAVALDNSSVWLPFGHSHIELSRGPALLASRYRLPVLYAAAPQQPDGRTAVNIVPAESRLQAGSGFQSPDDLTAQWLRRLQADIVRYPEQWWEWAFQTLGGAGCARPAATLPIPVPALHVETTR